VSFDRLAPFYRGMEALLAGGKLQRCRLAHLSETGGAREALLLGEGHGRFLPALLQENPSLRVTCVEASAGMIRIARRKCPEARVTFVHADALEWAAPAGRFDVVATHFFLDCFTAAQLAQLIPKLTDAAAPGARWLVADFQIPAAGWQRVRARAIHWAMYRFFRIFAGLAAGRLTDPTPFLAASGWKLRDRKVWNCGLLHASCWKNEQCVHSAR
jgi:ubiquinone/menaquinone biosynthesis C-methylase UbiE